MHRIDSLYSVDGEFANGSAITGVPGTRLDAAWLNAVQEELATTIEGFGGTLAKGTNTQIRDLLKASCQAVLTFGTPSLGPDGSGDPSYMVPGFGALLTTRCALPVPASGVIRNLRYQAASSPTGTDYIQITVLKNGVETALTTTVYTGQTSRTDAEHSFPVSAGDLIDVAVTASGPGLLMLPENAIVALALTMG